MVLGPRRPGLAGNLCGIVAVSLRCRKDGSDGGHHQFRHFFAHAFTSKGDVPVLPGRAQFFFVH